MSISPDRLAAVLTAVFLAVALIACGGGPDAADGGPRVVRDTTGDTAVVRTVSGSAWGGDVRLMEEMRIGRLEGPDHYTFGDVEGIAVGPDGHVYVVDGQGPFLRKYDPEGRFVATVAGPGEGPGELGRVDGGIAVFGDGRVAVRDPGNARISIFSPEGEFLEAWRIRGGMFSSTPLIVGPADTLYHRVFEFGESGSTDKLVPFGPDGETGDTIPYPDLGYESPVLEAERASDGGRIRSVTGVPFSAGESWAFSPRGYFVGGVSTSYCVLLLRPEGPLRIEKAHEPVPVMPGERENARARTTWDMRQTEPGWEWDGPAIPDTKPAYRRVWADEEGRIWVQLYTEGERIPEGQLEEREGSGDQPSDRWREPLAFDLFEPDGTYLGAVPAPRGLQTSPRPVARDETVWAVVRDELEVPYVVRYRLQRGAAAAE